VSLDHAGSAKAQRSADCLFPQPATADRSLNARKKASAGAEAGSRHALAEA
jgi:hypothetical protein